MLGSMGRFGAAGMESFFSLLQKNVLNRRSWATPDELRLAIATGSSEPLIDIADRPGWGV